jgi:hypothetical protein
VDADSLSRRSFIRKGGAFSVAALLASHVKQADAQESPGGGGSEPSILFPCATEGHTWGVWVYQMTDAYGDWFQRTCSVCGMTEDHHSTSA